MDALRLLLIEDSPDDAEILLRHLKDAGYETTFTRVEKESETRAALRAGPWDLVISDYNMPNFSALAALEILKETQQDLPFIVVSGSIGEELAVDAMKAGAHDYIMKDRLTRLAPAIERELRDAKLRNRLRDSQDQLRQAQKMEEIGRLAGGIAHDFNNTLAIILINCDQAIENAKSPELTQTLEEIKAAGISAANLTRQLLAFSRKQVLAPKTVDLNEIVLKMKKMLQHVITARIQLQTELASDLGKIKIDPNQMEQVILNLVINARDAIGGKDGKITLKTECIRKNGTENIQLSVIDTGCGMTPEIQAKVFEPFFTTKGPEKGTGLGLSMVYGIIKQSGGHVEIESTPGKGSTFKIRLTKEELEETEERTDPAAKPEPLASPGSSSVLLMEDRPELRNVLRRVLKNGGFSVICPETGNDAIELIRSGTKVDLLITDVVMPEMSGPELSKKVLTLQPKTRVLYMSGYSDTEQETIEMERSSGFIQKPFSAAQFLAKVQEVLKGNPA